MRLLPIAATLVLIVAAVLFTAPPAGTQNLVQVTVEFAEAEYTVTEGEDQLITVNLNRDPQRTVVIPIAVGSYLGSRDGVSDPTGDDYSVSDSVTFTSGQTSTDHHLHRRRRHRRTITMRCVALEIGAPLPAGVTAGPQSYHRCLDPRRRFSQRI